MGAAMTYYWPTEREHFGHSVQHLTSSGTVKIHPRHARMVVVNPTVVGFKVELPRAINIPLGKVFTLFNSGSVSLTLIRSANDVDVPSSHVATIPVGGKTLICLYEVAGNGDGSWLVRTSTGGGVPIR